MLDTPKRLTLDDWQPETFAVVLGKLLTERGQLDDQSLERARRLAAEGGARLDHVLTQLGLVSDRALAEAMAQILGLRLVAPADYPDAPILPDRLRAKFLRKARALPIQLSENSVT